MRLKKNLIIILLVISYVVWFPVSAFAGAAKPTESRSQSSWVYGEESDIYGSAGEVDLLADDEQEDDEPGIFVKLLMMPINALANAMYHLLDHFHITLDTIIMGRVAGHGIAISSKTLGNHVIALFTFELTKGNIYGIVASLVYTILRSVTYIIIVCAIYAKVVAAGWNGDGARAWQSFKSACGELVVLILMLHLMPFFSDIILYVRDVMLHLVYQMLRDGIGLDESSVSGLAEVFEELSDKGLLNSLMYLGSVVVTVWFMFQYVGLALTFCIYFFCFPFVCVNSLYARNELVEWWKSVIGNALVPLGDIVLLFIPAAFGLLGNGFAISVIQFCVCASLIPARSVLRAAMGIRSNFAMEMAAMGAMGGAMQFAGGVMRGFGRTAAGIHDAVSDMKMGEMYTQAYNSGGEGGSGSVGEGLPHPNDLNGGNGGSGVEPEILNKYANASNFEQPEFNGISNERRAELYRQRGMQKLAGAAIGGAGGVFGSLIGAGGGMFLGANSAGSLGSSLAAGGLQAASTGITHGTGFTRGVLDRKANEAMFVNPKMSMEAGNVSSGGVSYDMSGVNVLENNQPVTTDTLADSSDFQVSDFGTDIPNINIQPELVNDTVSGISGFSDAGFESYIGNQYDEIMASGAFSTKQERADELQLRASQYTKNHFDDWFSKEYPTAPTAVANQYHDCVDNYIEKRYRFDEKNGENTWDILSQNGAQKRHFTFEK